MGAYIGRLHPTDGREFLQGPSGWAGGQCRLAGCDGSSRAGLLVTSVLTALMPVALLGAPPCRIPCVSLLLFSSAGRITLPSPRPLRGGFSDNLLAAACLALFSANATGTWQHGRIECQGASFSQCSAVWVPRRYARGDAELTFSGLPLGTQAQHWCTGRFCQRHFAARRPAQVPGAGTCADIIAAALTNCRLTPVLRWRYACMLQHPRQARCDGKLGLSGGSASVASLGFLRSARTPQALTEGRVLLHGSTEVVCRPHPGVLPVRAPYRQECECWNVLRLYPMGCMCPNTVLGHMHPEHARD